MPEVIGALHVEPHAGRSAQDELSSFSARMNLGTWTNKSLACCSKFPGAGCLYTVVFVLQLAGATTMAWPPSVRRED